MASAASPQDSAVRFGVFELDPQASELRKAGSRIHLRPQAAKVLAILIRQPGKIVTREELKDEIWGADTFVDFEHGLNLCVRQIRAALNDDADTPRYIETLPRRGYRFIAPVENANGTHSGVPVTGAAVASPSAARRFPWRIAALAGGLAGVIAVTVVLAHPQWRPLWIGTPAPVRAIAVLPLKNLTGDATQDYFAAGMTDALTTDLAKIENLQVISYTSALHYAQANKSLPAIARELKADAIVEGAVERVGDRVRVTAQLIRASNDKHLWANTYERDFHDIMALQDEVAGAISQQIEKRLGGPKPAVLPAAAPVGAEAYETYLKANYYLDRWDLDKSIDYFNEAIKLDPNFAPAYAHMARAYFYLAFGEALPPGEGWGKVKQAAALAVQKDDHLADAHGALALAKLNFDWDFAGAEQEFKRALQLNPSDATIRHDYAHYLMAMGRVNESEAESRRAVELDPMGDSLIGCLCWHSFAARDYDESVGLAQRVLATHPHDSWERVILGWDFEQKHEPEQAIVEFKDAVDASKGEPDQPLYLAALGHAYALAGRKDDALQVLRTLLERAKTSYVSPFDVAVIYTALGDKRAAFAWLDKALAERSTFLIYAKWEPRLDPLRSDARFRALLQHIGFPA